MINTTVNNTTVNEVVNKAIAAAKLKNPKFSVDAALLAYREAGEHYLDLTTAQRERMKVSAVLGYIASAALERSPQSTHGYESIPGMQVIFNGRRAYLH